MTEKKSRDKDLKIFSGHYIKCPKIGDPKSVKSVKSVKKYYCHYCDYSASQKCHYDKHLSSKTSKIESPNSVQGFTKVAQWRLLGFFCKFCNKKYRAKVVCIKYKKM